MTIIINRKGEKEKLDFSKIKEVLGVAFEGIETINQLELESSFIQSSYKELQTRDIQAILIDLAISKITKDEPEWDLVASRLLKWDMYREYEVHRERAVYSAYEQDVLDLMEEGWYSSSLTDHYSLTELRTAGKWINPNYDNEVPYSSTNLMKQRYMVSPYELPQTVYLSCALLLAVNESNKLDFAQKAYHAIANRKVSLATPILANLRSAKSQNLTSCFIATIEDNIHSIFDTIKDAALISKNGGGVGINLSKVRSLNSTVMGKKGVGCGVMPWIKILNDTALAVNQGGKRKGSITVALDIWHYDVMRFLECQREEGDIRTKTFDIFPQLVIPDEFMRALENNDYWYLVDPYEVKQVFNYDLAELWGDEFSKAYRNIEQNIDKLEIVTKIKAKEIRKQILQSTNMTGLPYLAFKDTINRANPNKHEGYIPSVNLCVESFSNVKSGKYVHCCNLISLNLARIENDEIESTARLATRLLDNTIDVTTPPVKEAKAHNEQYRTIGVGMMGLADWLVKNNLTYESLSAISKLTETIAYSCIEESMLLSKERGAYKAFDGSDWSKGIYNGQTKLELQTKGNLDWITLLSDVQKYGIRNSHLLAIAPNTSSSLIQGCTASVLPLYQETFVDHAGQRITPVVPPYPSDKYQINTKLRQNIVIEAMATIQQWIDTGISMELIFNTNYNAYGDNTKLKAKDISDCILLAWRKGCKTIYYIRNVQLTDNVAQKQIDCDCSN